MPGIANAIGIPFKRGGISWSSYWTQQSEVLFFGLYSEISGGQMPNKVAGATDFLTVAGVAGSETYQCPNTAPYIAADTDYIWFHSDTTQRTATTAQLIGYDLQRTPVKYDDNVPNSIVAIMILNAAITGARLDRLFKDMWLPVLWDNNLNANGHIKSNRTGQQLWVEAAPTVTSTAITNKYLTIATSGGNVTSEGSESVTVRGVCWALGANPTTADSKTTDGSGSGAYSSSVTGLSENTTYHLRAYATNTIGTSYGADIQFTTQQTLRLDNFTAANGTHLHDHAPDIGGVWTAPGNEIQIQNNKLVFVGPDSTYVAYRNYGTADIDISVKITMPAENNYVSSILLRYVNSISYWRVDIERDAGGTPFIRIMRVNAFITLGLTNIIQHDNQEFTLRAVVSGNNFTAYWDGDGITTPLVTGTSDYNNSVTNHGVFGFITAAAYRNAPIDNYRSITVI